MNARQIEHFIRAVEHGSISKAARALGISQPALTKSLRQLEDTFQIKLLERTNFGVRATVFGERLYEHAKRAEGEFTRARYEIDALRGVHKGNVSIGAIPLITKAVLPAAMASLIGARPGITISITERYSSELFSAFRKGDFDFIAAALDDVAPEPGVVTKTLFYDELVVAVRSEHPLVKGKRFEPKNLLAYPWVFPRTHQPHRRHMEDFFRKARLDPPIGVVDGGSTALASTVVLQSDLIAVLSEHLIREDVESGRLAVIRLGSPVLRRPIGIAHRGWTKLSPTGRALIAELEKASRREVN